MKRDNIKEKLNDIFNLTVKGDKKQEQYDENSNLITDLGLNSVAMLYMIISIEEFFDMRFDDVAFGDFKTVKDVIDYIRLVAYYGYDYEGHNTMNYYLAAQELMWDKITNRETYWVSTWDQNGPRIDIDKEKNEIESLIIILLLKGELDKVILYKIIMVLLIIMRLLMLVLIILVLVLMEIIYIYLLIIRLVL